MDILIYSIVRQVLDLTVCALSVTDTADTSVYDCFVSSPFNQRLN